MKKALILCIVVVLALSVAACKGGGGKFADAKEVLDKYIGANEKFTAALEGANSPEAVVTALNALTETTKVLAPQFKAIEAKYPEFKNQDNPPEELKPLMTRLEAAAGKMMTAMQKIAQFATDPKVQEAQTKFTEAMALMK